MEDEEAGLKKQLDEAKDFETRREIRQKLREIRKKRINALDTDVGSSDRRSRRRQARENEADKTQKAAEVPPAVVQNQEDVNTVENGEVDEEQGGEKAVKENKRDEEEQETNGESVPEALNGGTERNKEGDEEEKEEKKEEEPAEEADEEDEPPPPAKPQRPSDGKITEEYVEQLEDVDDLEELLKEVSLSEFNIRKKIRNVIRERKKQRELEKFGMGKKLELSKGERGASSGRQRNTKTESDSREKNQRDSKSNIESFAEDTISSKLDTEVAAEPRAENSGKLFDDLEKSASKTCTDDTTDTASTLSTQSATSEPDTYSKSGSTEQEPARDSMAARAGKQQQKIFDLQKRETSSQSPAKPSDFRGQLKKTGVNLRSLEKKGKPEKIDFRTQLKKTGLNTTGASGGRRKDAPQVNFRSVLQSQGVSTSGKRSGRDTPEMKVTDISTPTERDRRQYLEEIKKSVASKPKSTAQLSSPDQEGAGEDEERVEEGGEKKERKRRVSSADLLGLSNQPRDNVKADLAQRVGRKTETPKSPVPQSFAPQRPFVSADVDEGFQAQMARRKKQVNTWQLKPSDITDKKSRGGKAETSDFRKVLRKASTSSHKPQIFKKQEKPEGTADAATVATALAVRKTSTASQSSDSTDPPVSPRDAVDAGKIQPEEASADDLDSSEDSDDVEDKAKEDKENDGSVQEERETRNITGGKEESSTRTETEVTSVGGSTVTVTKTSKTTQRTFGKGNIDDMFDKRKKERMMAKRKEAADKKQGRAAFKAKLEAQNPQPAGGGGRHFQSGGKITRAMIEWCRRNTYGYEGVDIQNFTTSWTNGLAMCALIHRFVPDKIDYETLDPKNRRANWKVAFDVAGECGVEPLLELEDIMSCSIPEPKSLMTYVHFIYQFFCEGPKERTPPPGWDEDED